MNTAVFYSLGAALIAVGIIIIILAIILSSIHCSGNRKVKYAGVIMIGPVPIIFGTDKKSVKTLLVFALALMVAVIITMIIFYLLLR